MRTVRVNCPSCRRLFEVEEEFRGERVDCPRCSVPFQIPLAGAEGVLLDTEPDDAPGLSGRFDISCPYCRTLFELPDNFRGELAECAECQSVFVIPEQGNQGVRIDENSAAPAGAANGDSPPAGQRREPHSEGETSSGILVEPSLSSAAASGTATVRLSRREVVANLMKPSPLGLGGERFGQGYARGNGNAQDGDAGDHLDAPFEGHAEGSFIPLDDVDGLPRTHQDNGEYDRLPIRFSDMPPWVPRIDLEQDEVIVEFEAGAEPSFMAYYLLTGIPALLIPAAVILAQFVHPAASASVCFLLALVLWGTFAVRLLPALARRILILTSERAIMADEREVVDIDIE